MFSTKILLMIIWESHAIVYPWNGFEQFKFFFFLSKSNVKNTTTDVYTNVTTFHLLCLLQIDSFSDCHMLSQYLPTKGPIYFCQNFRLPYDIDNQCSPTSPLTSPANDDRARWSGWPPSPPPSPEPPVLGPDWLRLPGRLRPQNGRRKLSSTDLPFPQAMLWHNR